MLRSLLYVFVFIVITIMVVIGYLKYQVNDQKIEYILDQCTLSLESQLKNEQMNALEIAVVLSKNEGLVNALENDNEDLGYKILSDIMLSIKTNTNRYIRTQIITSEYNIFARSWDNVYAGMPLEDYRTDLDYFKTHTTPRTSIEVGRRLGIKATVPIYKEGVFLGFIEVIDFFESITKYFSKQGIDLYVMLEDKYFDTAILMQENLTVDRYIVSNRNYNFNHIQTLNKIDFKTLKVDRILYVDNKYIFYETMNNGEGQTIGAFVFVLPEKYLDYFKDPEDDISFLVNVTRSSLYDVVKEEQYQNNMYDKYSVDSLLYIKDIIAKEDRELFFDEAYKKLDAYSKDELIQLMLEHKIIKKIDGKIK
ncbi:hypothetical protein KJ877_04905 [bacterium]|nr:hypothetical protein [bacterium]MBU1990425.1 hypothetical protein [bacterium]